MELAAPGGDEAPRPAEFKVSVEVPVTVATAAELMLWLPGHQATKTPLPLDAVTWLPSLSESVTPVTPVPVRPTTKVYGWPS